MSQRIPFYPTSPVGAAAMLLLGLAALVNVDRALAQTSDRIQPFSENLQYWQYEGQALLPLGGSKDDNLFQIPGLKAHLDSMKAVGANYIRNTMCARNEEDDNVRPLARTESGKYDLTELNPE